MGAAIATQIMTSGHAVLWCPDGRSTATVRRAEAAGLRPAPLGELLANSEVVLSICPPAVAEEIAIMVAGFGYRGSYVEANAISPARMQRITTRFTGAGTTVIDGCIFGSPPGGDPPAQLYLAGAATAARRVADLFAGSLAEPVILGEHSGQASALKMIFSCFQRPAALLPPLRTLWLTITVSPEHCWPRRSGCPAASSLTGTTCPRLPPGPGAGHRRCTRSPTRCAPSTYRLTLRWPPPPSWRTGLTIRTSEVT
jgi:hypothetical protein